MSKGRAYYQLISYGDAVYAMGGHDGSELDSMERWTRGGGWVSVANLPYSNHRFCAVADELSDRIYMIAGGSNTNRRKLCRYYTVSSNTWGDCGSLQNKTIVSRYRYTRGSISLHAQIRDLHFFQ